MEGVPYRQLQSVSFGVYRPQEIKKLSVVEINSPNTFDLLEHPQSGGLYDPRLGPSNQDELCETCGLKSLYCPGHVGHITLPLPVFHPVFIKTLYQLLQGTCFSCHRLVAPINAIQLALHQFQALDYGLVGTVEQLNEALSDPALISEKSAGSQFNVVLALKEKLEGIVKKAIEGLDLEEEKSRSQVKSVVECRQRVRKNFLRSHFTNAKSKCPHCHEKKTKIALRNNNQFIKYVGVSTKKDALKKTDVRNSIQENLEKDGHDQNVDDTLSNSKVEKDDELWGNISITATDAKKHLNIVWEKENVFLKRLFGILNKEIDDPYDSPINVFFIEILMVPPSRFRPIMFVRGRKYLNPQTTVLKEVLSSSLLLKNLIKVINGEEILEADKELVNKIIGKTNNEKFTNLWRQLQVHVNCVYDTDLDKLNKDRTSTGVKQILEKKEGLFRKHMMGKRVNFAARSVISPDPYIMVDEIGLPAVFAKKLTYPTPVTDWNVEKLRMAVMNGPNVHPGADKIEMEDGRVVKLSPTDSIQRQAHACQLLTPSPSAKGVNKGIPKKVHRHVDNGDVLLLNRQPTLHKPSIMAHKVRVLPGEKTLRLHYANCKSYNADFDGDEMNAHFPQNEVARSEGFNIVGVNHQYLVPKDGTPLSGLIQDHIIAGTLLTMRGQFFNREDYLQLVYGAISFMEKPIKTLHPSMLKPEVLWSGKQIISTIIINIIPKGKPPPTIEGKAKVSVKNWQSEPPREWFAGGTLLSGENMTESQVVIHSGELLCGIIDKAHIGPTPYGLIHCCYELYGGKTSTALLTALARLFTHYLQAHRGFTLGLEDILLTDLATKKRQKVMRKARKVGDKVVSEAFNVEDVENKSELHRKYQSAHLSREDIGLKTLDFEMKKATDAFNNDINGICMPDGLLKKFPYNNLQLMVQSGAKGSTVNAMQISCALGQIELEGRRVPLMINGSSLPSFLPYDTSPRAGGFIDGRFLTGIRPQEFFFHCMAGREGLVDTAVKTSRSGYLQRCLIKHLEGLVVNYDLTVRDSDGSVVQFLYGEDGLDICKSQMLKDGKLNLLADNYDSVINENEINTLKSLQVPTTTVYHKKPKKKIHKRVANITLIPTESIVQDTMDKDTVYNNKISSVFVKGSYHSYPEFVNVPDLKKHCPDPINSMFRPDLMFGSISENMDSVINNYVNKNYLRKKNGRKSHLSEEKQLEVVKFVDMCYYRAVQSLVHPGEAVGLLAAQSIGEPSTQMTLNTFHFAGRGEMNVTLGIPRLREILMVASASIATPTMDMPLLAEPNIEQAAEKLKVKLSSVTLKQVLTSIEVKDMLIIKDRRQRGRNYVIKMNFLPPEVYEGILYTSPSQILKFIENNFINRIISCIKKKLASLFEARLLTTERKNVKVGNGLSADDESNPQSSSNAANEADEGASSDDEGQLDGDTVSTKTKMRHNQELEYEEPESDENVDDPAYEETMDITTEQKDDEDKEEESSDDNGNEGQDISLISICEAGVLSRKQEKEVKVNQLKHKYSQLSDYDYDSKKNLWCKFTLKYPLEGSKIDLRSLIEEEANNTVVYSVPGIKKVFLIPNPSTKGTSKMLRADGVNFLEVFKYVNIIDTTKIYSNDIHAIAKIYGIEAANKVIVKEIKNVFATYGIEVDSRHLLLIADYMTFDGTFKACNRIGMESNASPLQQMTFETTMSFLQNATLNGSIDQLKSPSARLVVGQPVTLGTGCFDLFLKPYKADMSRTKADIFHK